MGWKEGLNALLNIKRISETVKTKEELMEIIPYLYRPNISLKQDIYTAIILHRAYYCKKCRYYHFKSSKIGLKHFNISRIQ